MAGLEYGRAHGLEGRPAMLREEGLTTLAQQDKETSLELLVTCLRVALKQLKQPEEFFLTSYLVGNGNFNRRFSIHQLFHSFHFLNCSPGSVSLTSAWIPILVFQCNFPLLDPGRIFTL